MMVRWVVLVACGAAAEPWTCTPPKQHDFNCKHIDRVKVDADYGTYFATHRKPKCALGIINAGMPRTGSTLLSQLAEEAVRQLQHAFPKKKIAYTNGGFWRMDRHKFNHEKWLLNAPKKERNRIEVIQVKVHEWDSELNTELCDQNLVLLTEREVLPTLVSEVVAFGLNSTNLTCDGLHSGIVYNTQANFCWQTHARSPLRFAYEEMNHGKVAVTATIATKVAGLLGLSFDDPGAAVALPFDFPPGFHEADANPQFAGLARGAADYDAELDAKVKEHFPPECSDRDVWNQCFKDII